MTADFGFVPNVTDGEYYFVSYNIEDSDRVGEYVRKLNDLGVPLWYDYGLEYGLAWEMYVADHIRKCKSVVMFITGETFSKGKSYVRTEYEMAVNHYNKQIHVVKLSNINEKDVPEQFMDWWAEISCMHCIENPTVDRIIDAINFKISPDSEQGLRRGIGVGDIVEFGRYPQGIGGEIQPLRWRVLEVQDETVLLLTEKCIELLPYNDECVPITWETCTLRSWMNGDFIRKAFSKVEQEALAVSDISNAYNLKHSIWGGNNTQDKVFTLSIKEAEKYFSLGGVGKTYSANYAKSEGCFASARSGASCWWLRSPGGEIDSAAYINLDGYISSNGYLVDSSDVAVRAACRVLKQRIIKTADLSTEF